MSGGNTRVVTQIDHRREDRRDRSDSLVDRLRSVDPLDVVPRLLLVLVLIDLAGPWLIPAAAVFAVVLLEPRLYRSPWLWFAITAARGVTHARDWYDTDDHLVLVTYGCLAAGVAFSSSDQRTAMRSATRWLIVGTMGFATLWKVTSGQFNDATFFEYVLAADGRFAWFVERVGGVDPAVLADNRRAIVTMAEQNVAAPSTSLQSTDRLRLLARALTLGTIALEGFLVVVWASGTAVATRLRVPALIMFCAVTYGLVPVTIFGAILLTLAYASAPSVGQRRAVLVALPVLVVLGPIWQAVTSTPLG